MTVDQHKRVEELFDELAQLPAAPGRELASMPQR